MGESDLAACFTGIDLHAELRAITRMGMHAAARFA